MNEFKKIDIPSETKNTEIEKKRSSLYYFQ